MKLEFVQVAAEYAAGAVELFGIAVIIMIGVYSTSLAVINFLKGANRNEIFENYRHLFGRGILLGLEFLVAADIIHTVAVDLSFSSLGVLALIVVIRTFLSFTLELEITHRWPWQQKKD